MVVERWWWWWRWWWHLVAAAYLFDELLRLLLLLAQLHLCHLSAQLGKHGAAGRGAPPRSSSPRSANDPPLPELVRGLPAASGVALIRLVIGYRSTISLVHTHSLSLSLSLSPSLRRGRSRLLRAPAALRRRLQRRAVHASGTSVRLPHAGGSWAQNRARSRDGHPSNGHRPGAHNRAVRVGEQHCRPQPPAEHHG